MTVSLRRFSRGLATTPKAATRRDAKNSPSASLADAISRRRLECRPQGRDYLHAVIPSSRGSGVSMSPMSVWSAQTIASEQLGDRGPGQAGRCAAAVTDDRRTTAVQMVAFAGNAGPPSSQSAASVNANLVSRHEQCPGPAAAAAAAGSAGSAGSAAARLPLHILSTVHYCQVPNAPMPRQIPCPALPCPASLLPCCFHPVQSCPFSLSGPPLPPVQCSAMQCSALARPILLPESHPISCSARRRQACVPPSQRHLPALPVSSEMPVCWPSHGGVADIALKSPCLPSAPTCGSISATWDGGIKS